MTVIFDPFEHQVHADPYPAYRILRDEYPVYRNEERDFWALSRFEDLQIAARDWQTFSNSESVPRKGGTKT